MKKLFTRLLVCLFILAVFAGFLFFLGWTQFKVRPGTVGILVSKTGGVYSEPIYPGTFSWHWEFLIPSNATLCIFEQKTYQFTKKYSGKLPSSELLGNVNGTLGVAPDFSYSVEITSRSKVSDERLIKLVKENAVSTQKELDSLVEDSCDSLFRYLTSVFLKKSETEILYNPEPLSTEELLSLCDATEKYPFIEFLEVSVKKASFPDYAMYVGLRNAYIEQLASAKANFAQKNSENSTQGTSASSAEKTSSSAQKTESSENTSSDSDEIDEAFISKLKKLLEKK